MNTLTFKVIITGFLLFSLSPQGSAQMTGQTPGSTPGTGFNPTGMMGGMGTGSMMGNSFGMPVPGMPGNPMGGVPTTGSPMCNPLMIQGQLSLMATKYGFEEGFFRKMVRPQIEYYTKLQKFITSGELTCSYAGSYMTLSQILTKYKDHIKAQLAQKTLPTAATGKDPFTLIAQFNNRITNARADKLGQEALSNDLPGKITVDAVGTEPIAAVDIERMLAGAGIRCVPTASQAAAWSSPMHSIRSLFSTVSGKLQSFHAQHAAENASRAQALQQIEQMVAACNDPKLLEVTKLQTKPIQEFIKEATKISLNDEEPTLAGPPAPSASSDSTASNNSQSRGSSTQQSDDGTSTPHE